jgi:hypothetical protein
MRSDSGRLGRNPRRRARVACSRMVRKVVLTVLVASGMGAAAQVPDNLKCYTVHDPLKFSAHLDLDTELGADSGCTISGRARLYCVAAAATNLAASNLISHAPIDPLRISRPQPGDRVCYKVKCPNRPVDQVMTDQFFAGRTLSRFRVSLVCRPAFRGSARFVDNGDGTVTDQYTGLQWEKKDSKDGHVTFADPHDADNTYTWSSSGTAPDGTVFTDFLAKLNNCTADDLGNAVSGGFAGHCDWRLPTVAELGVIADCPTTDDCVVADPAFGPNTGPYWSSATYAQPGNPTAPTFALALIFDGGDFDGVGGEASIWPKAGPGFFGIVPSVRAVRSGS